MISVQNLAIVQGNFALRDISFTIPTGKHAVLMGQTGCGKTSIIEAIAGIRPIKAGRIQLFDVDVTNLEPKDRRVGYLPQDLALFKTMTVEKQIGFGMELRSMSQDTIRTRVEELAEWMDIKHLLKRKPIGLSGGESQRVALARALSYQPRILLLDEPFSSLDDQTRDKLIELFKEVQQRTQVTTLHISHSLRDAQALGDLRFQLRSGILHTL